MTAIVSIQLSGAPELLARLAVAPEIAVRAMASALYTEGQSILSDSQPLVPVETGTLRASGAVELPAISGTAVEVVIGYGGAAQDYAIVQHEHLEFAHPHGGQAKFLEQPALEHGATMEPRLGERLAAALQLGLR